MRVVLDTNVLVSALNFPGGSPESSYRLVVERKAELVISAPLLAELRRVLTGKFGWGLDRSESTLAQLIRLAVMTAPTEDVAEITADPADNRVLEAAAAGAAEIIVSGDRHLLQLGSWRGIRIVTPAAFLAEFQ